MFFDMLIFAALALVLFLAVSSIIRGYKNIKIYKHFETSNNKSKITYLIFSVLHMVAGILISLCYVIAIILVILYYIRG